MTEEQIENLITEGGEIVERAGTQLRVLGSDGKLYDVATSFWYELKEAE